MKSFINTQGKMLNVWKEEDGLGTLEILLIIAVLVVVAIVFREWIISWVNQLFTETNNQIQNNQIQPITPNNAGNNTTP